MLKKDPRFKTIPPEILRAVSERYGAPLKDEQMNDVLTFVKNLGLSHVFFAHFQSNYNDQVIIPETRRAIPTLNKDAIYNRGSSGRKVKRAKSADRQSGPTTAEEY